MCLLSVWIFVCVTVLFSITVCRLHPARGGERWPPARVDKYRENKSNAACGHSVCSYEADNINNNTLARACFPPNMDMEYRMVPNKPAQLSTSRTPVKSSGGRRSLSSSGRSPPAARPNAASTPAKHAGTLDVTLAGMNMSVSPRTLRDMRTTGCERGNAHTGGMRLPAN